MFNTADFKISISDFVMNNVRCLKIHTYHNTYVTNTCLVTFWSISIIRDVMK
jgi:hypothetical protein